ncbi:MAG: aldo/keto reductase, partial [Clostridiales bacterium]|nr:aldo/keto reductase [Clostridiales bacterium]
RDSYYLATKLPIWECRDEADMERLFQTQMEKLKTDYFDFYLLHSLTQGHVRKCQKLHAYEFVKRKQAEGRIRFVGFSFHDKPRVLEQIVREWDFDFAQLQINYLDWYGKQNAAEQYRIVTEAGLPCIVMEPVRGGKLADLGEAGNALLKGRAPDASIASWAMRFAASLDNVLTVLSGMSSMEQLRDNMETLSGMQKLTEEEFRLLAHTVPQGMKTRGMAPCTGCRYCMDCPAGVDIPLMLNLYNQYRAEKDLDGLRRAYFALEEGVRAARCVGCGQCSCHCPQRIAIPGKMKELQTLCGE